MKNQTNINSSSVNYFNGLEWDGKKRIDTILIRALGVEDSEFARQATNDFFESAITRSFNPGAPVPTFLALIGPKGIGKSEFARRICPISDLFESNMPPILTKAASERIVGKMIVELSEFEKDFAAGDLKAFISQKNDSIRVPFESIKSEVPRTFTFILTSNNEDLYDELSDSRRIFALMCNNDLDVDLIESERDQLWAEAFSYYLDKTMYAIKK